MPNYKDFELDVQKNKEKDNKISEPMYRTQYDCRSLYGSGSCRACCEPY